ncbi:DUF512 domain-containing protein [Natronospora cellulosivora (SeqCode)]
MIKIIDVQPDSIAKELEIHAGDNLLEVNGQAIKDYIDFQYNTNDDFFTLLVEKEDGQIWELEIEREAGENLGIVLDGIIYDNLKLCKNNCLFCFVKQQAKDMRKSLLIKDDDYRFSFLQGSFITLTNIDDYEFKRIISLKLSPLYISVHTTNPELRVEMMKNKNASLIMKHLKFLASNGIKFHTQIVLCPNVNDGKELDKTIEDLSSLYPAVLSIGVVPVGLTQHRDDLPKLKKFNSENARRTVTQIEIWQKKFKEKIGKNILHIADEFYFLANKEIPNHSDYDGFPQIENGIGLSRLLWYNFENYKPNIDFTKKDIGIITSVLGEKAIKPIVSELRKNYGLNINVYTVENEYFGKTITVSGLLTARDIISTLSANGILAKDIFLPAVLLNQNNHFLDDYSFEDFKKIFSNSNFYVVDDFSEMLEVLKNV